ncbi:MAG TPA: Ig-like domain-containing domain [Chitinophagaceae bacterium]|nr:Ig-like domain-containing domain [Chitinophagaceae bacterium]
MKRPFSIQLIVALAFFALLIADGIGLSGCANIVPPSGGPRDSLPPVLLDANPDDSSTNFGNYRVTFTFDEFVEVNSIMENLIVSPTPKTMPDVQSRLRTVTVRLKDTLEPNTTYSLNFGNAIRDINENNELKDFTYIFSTGPVFDSLQLRGRVILAETGGSDSTLIVLLHTSTEDSAVAKDRPRYYTRVDANGNFTFKNLPADTFAVYALKDEGGMKRYQSKSQLFGFADQPVRVAPGGTPPVTLYAYRETAETPRTTTATGTGTATGRPQRGATQQDRILRVATNIENEQLDLLNNLEVRFTTPLKTFDSTKVRFTDEQFNTIPGYPLVLDTSRKLLTLRFPWQGNTTYNVIVDKDFAEDTLGRKLLRNDTLTFRTRKESDYGSLKLRFLNLDMSKNPVLLFVQGEQVKHTHVFTGRDVNIRLFVPGEYEMRILYDENRNGKWDPGSFFGTRRQPEKVMPLTRRLNVRSNWDNEIDITL